jgi:hypothetical protein
LVNISAESLEELRDEAARQRAHAAHHTYRTPTIEADGNFIAERRNSYSPAGPGLDAWHTDDAVLASVGKLTGCEVFPTRATYVYYDVGDFIGLHVDVALSRVTLLSRLSPVDDPVYVCPELLRVPLSKVLEEATSDYARRGKPVPVPVGGFLAIAGADLPHFRPPGDEECLVVSMCYDYL